MYCFINFLTLFFLKNAFFFSNEDIFVEFANSEIKVKADTLGSKLMNKLFLRNNGFSSKNI